MIEVAAFETIYFQIKLKSALFFNMYISIIFLGCNRKEKLMKNKLLKNIYSKESINFFFQYLDKYFIL